MKENLKIRVKGQREWDEARVLLNSLDNVENYEIYMDDTYTKHDYKLVTMDELHELARPKEYLNDKFELVVTNQPLDGFILVPDGADYFGYRKDYCTESFYKRNEQLDALFSYSPQGHAWHQCPTNIVEKILWQRNPRQEEVMKEEKKGREGNAGRFLHQWAYEAFGRGEDLEYIFNTNLNDVWEIVNYDNVLLNIFNDSQTSFRLKPQTITIGSRTIVKPISVKPENGTDIYTTNITAERKYSCFTWLDSESDDALLVRNICHLTAGDAIVMADALLELMK